jgi:exonuclease SbcD
MKLLHTSDLHIGRLLYGQSLEADHEVILNQILETMNEQKPDAVILAGDIYDRVSPPASAVKQFNNFIRRFRDQSEAALILIAGNHDSGDRIDAMSTLANEQRALISGPVRADDKPLILEDEHGPVAFSALPFATEYLAREEFDDSSISSPADVIQAQVEAARQTVPDNVRWVISAHTFVTNAEPSEAERKISVGGVETVPADTFDDAHYVALGHLHRPQTAGADHINYSGAPLAFGFDESDATKTMSLVDLDGTGAVQIERIPFKPVRRMRTLNGAFEELLEAARKAPSEDYIKLVLNDHGALVDPMAKIREYYPNALLLQYERNLKPVEPELGEDIEAHLDKPEDVIKSFLTEIRGEPPLKEELSFVDQKLHELQEVEAKQ